MKYLDDQYLLEITSSKNSASACESVSVAFIIFYLCWSVWTKVPLFTCLGMKFAISNGLAQGSEDTRVFLFIIM